MCTVVKVVSLGAKPGTLAADVPPGKFSEPVDGAEGNASLVVVDEPGPLAKGTDGNTILVGVDGTALEGSGSDHTGEVLAKPSLMVLSVCSGRGEPGNLAGGPKTDGMDSGSTGSMDSSSTGTADDDGVDDGGECRKPGDLAVAELLDEVGSGVVKAGRLDWPERRCAAV